MALEHVVRIDASPLSYLRPSECWSYGFNLLIMTPVSKMKRNEGQLFSIIKKPENASQACHPRTLTRPLVLFNVLHVSQNKLQLEFNK